jgi:hypothetical protein
MLRPGVLCVLSVWIAAQGCGNHDEERVEKQGACTLPTNQGNGPTYCRDDSYHSSYCIVFREGGTCDSLGYDFCCSNDSIGDWRFQSREDAEWHDEIYGQDCTYSQVPCATGNTQPATEEGCAWADCRSDAPSGSYQCQGNTIVRCDNGAWKEVVRCPALQNSDGYSCTCKGGCGTDYTVCSYAFKTCEGASYQTRPD